ncbi:hypothetical protein [Serratia marcescens]|uniref:hypothetical protein n=1 Tax=Serratia marcescens TaxID=615 RepID=UPI0009A5529B|nr:hypothetical protein [Serratia marcescens]OPJ96316.1 hypothetical protein B1R44_14830 [Serratia marcescens]
MNDSNQFAADPRCVIYDFLKNLPDTIRTEELMFVLLYGTGRAPFDESDNFLPLVEQYLMRPGYPGVGAVICSMAIIDRRLNQSEEKLVKAEVDLKHLIRSYPDFPQVGLLSLPLRKKHYSLALERWNDLKKGPLAEHNLMRYEGNPSG